MKEWSNTVVVLHKSGKALYEQFSATWSMFYEATTTLLVQYFKN